MLDSTEDDTEEYVSDTREGYLKSLQEWEIQNMENRRKREVKQKLKEIDERFELEYQKVKTYWFEEKKDVFEEIERQFRELEGLI